MVWAYIVGTSCNGERSTSTDMLGRAGRSEVVLVVVGLGGELRKAALLSKCELDRSWGPICPLYSRRENMWSEEVSRWSVGPHEPGDEEEAVTGRAGKDVPGIRGWPRQGVETLWTQVNPSRSFNNRPKYLGTQVFTGHSACSSQQFNLGNNRLLSTEWSHLSMSLESSADVWSIGFSEEG